MSNIWLNYGGKGLKFGSGIKVSVPAGPQNMLYYDLGSETISARVKKTIDLRSAGLPSSSPDRPAVVFYFDVQLTTPTKNSSNTVQLNSSVDTSGNYLVIFYDRLPFVGTNFGFSALAFMNSDFPTQQPSGLSFKLKIIYYDEGDPTYNPRFGYQLWSGSQVGAVTYAIRTQAEGVRPSPYDVAAMSSSAGGTTGNITLSNLRCAGFTNLADAEAWNGESF